jgi:Leucine-rich repeat (LRR) protein
LTNIERIYLSNNNLSGEIPMEVGDLKELSSLHLENNPKTTGSSSSSHPSSRA